MSVLNYGAVRMQIQKTEHIGFIPRYTEDGVDYLYTELDLAVTAVINPFALATRGPGQIAAIGAVPPFQEDAPAQANGDSVGATIRNIRAMLLTPRQTLTFSINNDQVVTIAGPDSKQGPLPQSDTAIRWIMGTHTALVYFHIKAWAPDLLPAIQGLPTPARRIVLANRYRVASATDENWYSRRHIQGQMIIDPSQLIPLAADGVLTPDNFRQAAFLSIPTGFKREDIQVVVSSDNTTLDYSYVDQEQPLALGLRSLATKIEGGTTVGLVSPLNGLTGPTAAAVAAPTAAANLANKAIESDAGKGFFHGLFGDRFGSLFRGGAAMATNPNTVATVVGSAVNGLPKITGSGIVRIWGQRNANKADLATLGVNILLDRFNTGFFSAYFAPGDSARAGTVTVTQDLVERMVEVSMTFIPTFVAQVTPFVVSLANAAIAMNNLSTDIRVAGQQGQLSGIPSPTPLANAGPLLSGSILGLNPPPPFSSGTRGDWLGALVVALLGTPGEIPVNAPADPAINIDTPFL